MKWIVPALVMFVFLIAPAFVSEVHAANWYNLSWNDKLNITVNASSLSADVLEFPVYVDLSKMPASFFSDVKSDGSDIVITDVTENVALSRELVFINIANKTGELYFRANLSSSVNNVFWIYYENPSVTLTNNKNTWSEQFFGVWHMQQSANATQFDSTPRGNNLSGNLFPSDTSQPGRFGSSVAFLGTASTIYNVTGLSKGFLDSQVLNRTVQTWAIASTTTGSRCVFYTADGATRWYICTDAATPNHWQLGYGATSSNFGNNVTNNWEMLTYQQKDNTGSFYVNKTRAGLVNYTNYTLANTVHIGASSPTADRFIGNIDEIRVRTAMTTAEISATYDNMNTPASFMSLGAEQSQDTTPPVITITQPVNTTYGFSNISVSVSANEPIDKWYYTLNGGSQVFFLPNTTINGTQGSNALVVFANDTSGNLGNSTVGFTINSAVPSITIFSPANTTYNNANITLAVTNGIVDKWWYILNGGVNNTFLPNTTILGVEGFNHLQVYANNTGGQLNTTAVNFTVDTIYPVITILSPLNTTYGNPVDVVLAVTANEIVTNWEYSLNGDEVEAFTPNTTFNASAGTNVLIVNATDLAGNENSTTVYFTIDVTPPVVTILSPSNSTYFFLNTSLEVTANGPVDTWYYVLNGGSPVAFMPNTSFNGTPGSNTVIVYANDTFGNLGSSQVSFTIDTTVFSISILQPANTTYSVYNQTLDVAANKVVDVWYYILNGGSPVLFVPPTTFTAANHSNSITVFANTTLGANANDTVGFTITEIAPVQPAPITGPNALILALLPVLLAVGLLVILVKRLFEMDNMIEMIELIIAFGIAIVLLGVFFAIISGLI